MSPQERFFEKSEKKAFDKVMRQKIETSLNNYQKNHALGLTQFENLALAKERASYSRWRAIESLDKFLLEFENNFVRRGGKVVWAPDAESALQELENILSALKPDEVVMSKSMATEEIGLPAFLEKKNIVITETDIGKYIQQQAKERPFHPVVPAMHKSVEDIASILQINSVDMSAKNVAEKIRSHFPASSLGITGANFLVADIGAISIAENEGNARMGTSWPDVHVVIAGIEKVIPAAGDLEVLLPILATYGTGQRVTAYNSLLLGPRMSDEADGPKEMIVILLDNGRSSLLEKPEQRQALKCIRCGACLNVCPIFKTIGGQTYETTYNGPIGAVITPIQVDRKEYKHLTHASTLCGACTDVCPVQIPLHMNLLANRRDFNEDGMAKGSEKMIWYAWKKGVLNRKKMNRGAGMKNFFLKTLFKKQWGERRAFPEFAPKSFNELWREKHGDRK
jgi:L-lactate dehydrogenase complex protein LldF